MQTDLTSYSPFTLLPNGVLPLIVAEALDEPKSMYTLPLVDKRFAAAFRHKSLIEKIAFWKLIHNKAGIYKLLAIVLPADYKIAKIQKVFVAALEKALQPYTLMCLEARENVVCAVRLLKLLGPRYAPHQRQHDHVCHCTKSEGCLLTDKHLSPNFQPLISELKQCQDPQKLLKENPILYASEKRDWRGSAFVITVDGATALASALYAAKINALVISTFPICLEIIAKPPPGFEDEACLALSTSLPTGYLLRYVSLNGNLHFAKTPPYDAHVKAVKDMVSSQAKDLFVSHRDENQQTFTRIDVTH